ncbi:hypothetical protein AUP68_15955 [Ilyonectria robusta]
MPNKTELSYRPKLFPFESESESELGEDDDLLIIGIDFGTTYSGVAWATKVDFESEQINVITTWPGNGREEGKAPTELYYEHDQIMWGYEMDSDVDPIRWFKLLLLKEEDISPELRSSEFLLRARKMMKENGKTAMDLISDYLRMLWKHIMDTISRDRGPNVLDALQLHVVITVPAIWKDYARQQMQEAAKKSGILDRRRAGPTNLTFAPEPEAAALATLCEPNKSKNVKKGDVYLVCDAGGGTVDLISYKINSTNPIHMGEAAEGTGGLCGGIFIDEVFERIVKNRLGRGWDQLSRTSIKDIMRGEWEQSIKPQFKPTNARKEYIVSIPAEAFRRQSLDDMSREPFIKKGRIHFSGAQIECAFTGVFDDIDKLVDAQIHKAKDQGLSAIILVGGFGASPYLYTHLQDRHKLAGISILQSEGIKPRTAICRGAVYKGFLDGKVTGANGNEGVANIVAPIRVTSTISRASYGVMYRDKFDFNQHLKEDKVWSPEQCEWRADNQMAWFLKRGENVSKIDPVTKEYYRLYRKDFGGTWEEFIYQCADEEPPSRKISSVNHLSTIECSLDIPFDALADYQNSAGENMKKMEYSVKMVPSGASMEFAVSIDGRNLGRKNANVRFE